MSLSRRIEKKCCFTTILALGFLLFVGATVNAPFFSHGSEADGLPWIETRIVTVQWSVEWSYEVEMTKITFNVTGEIWNPTANTINYTAPDSCIFEVVGMAELVATNELTELLPSDQACAQVISSIALSPGITRAERSAFIEVMGIFTELPEGVYNFSLFGRSQSIYGIYHVTRIVFSDGKPVIIPPSLPPDWGYRKSPATGGAGFLAFRFEETLIVVLFTIAFFRISAKRKTKP